MIDNATAALSKKWRYQAIAGDTNLKTAEIEYLLSLEDAPGHYRVQQQVCRDGRATRLQVEECDPQTPRRKEAEYR